jgi:hypothetical protein
MLTVYASCNAEPEVVSLADNNADVELSSCQQFVDEDIVREIAASVGPVLPRGDRDEDDDDAELEKLEEAEMRAVTSAKGPALTAPGLPLNAAVLGLRVTIEDCLKVPAEKGMSLCALYYFAMLKSIFLLVFFVSTRF